jgi:hypothetical protein
MTRRGRVYKSKKSLRRYSWWYNQGSEKIANPPRGPPVEHRASRGVKEMRVYMKERYFKGNPRDYLSWLMNSIRRTKPRKEK